MYHSVYTLFGGSNVVGRFRFQSALFLTTHFTFSVALPYQLANFAAVHVHNNETLTKIVASKDFPYTNH